MAHRGKNCRCNEGQIAICGDPENTSRITEYRPTGLKAHDCDYIESRNALIPEAELRARGSADEFRRIMDMLTRKRIHGQII